MITLTHMHPETREQCRDALEDLAKRWDDIPPRARDRMLHEVTALRGEPLRVAMEALRGAISTADRLEPDCDVPCGNCEALLPGVICDPAHEAWLLACGRVVVAANEMLRDPVVTS